MQLSTGIFWGLMALFSWGIADYLARSYSVRVGSFRATFYINLIGLSPIVVILVIQVFFSQFHSPIDWSLLLTLGPALGFIQLLVYLAYYRGLQKGLVSVVTSVTSAWLAVTVLLAVLFLGESLSPYYALLIAFITAGILMLSGQNQSESNKSTGFRYGLIAMILLGTFATFMKPLTVAIGVSLAVFIPRIMCVILGGLILPRFKVALNFPGRKDLHILILASLLDVGGYLFYAVGIATAPIFIVAPVAAAHPVATIFLAWLRIKERPVKIQTAGIIVILTGVIALSATTAA